MHPSFTIKNEMRGWWKAVKLRAGYARSAASVPNTPLMEAETIEALRESMRKCSSYLEYGSGGSTIMATSEVLGHITSIESDRIFANAVRQAIPESARARVRVIHADIGPTRELGKPVLTVLSSRWPNYARAPWTGVLAAIPDLVLVDGRFRVACVLQTFLHTPEGWEGTVFLDDYEKRKEAYSAILPFIVNVRRSGRALVFNKGRFSEESCRVALKEARLDWR